MREEGEGEGERERYRERENAQTHPRSSTTTCMIALGGEADNAAEVSRDTRFRRSMLCWIVVHICTIDELLRGAEV